MTDAARAASPSSTSHYPRMAVGLVGAAIIVLGTAVDAVTVGRGPLTVSLTVGQVSPRAHLALGALVIIACAALLVSQLGGIRAVAWAAVLAFAAVVAAAIYILMRADNPSGLLETAAIDLANPKPALGFYLLVVGALVGIAGGVACATDTGPR